MLFFPIVPVHNHLLVCAGTESPAHLRCIQGDTGRQATRHTSAIHPFRMQLLARTGACEYMSTQGQFTKCAFIKGSAELLREAALEFHGIRWTDIPGQGKKMQRVEDILQIGRAGALSIEVVDAQQSFRAMSRRKSSRQGKREDITHVKKATGRGSKTRSFEWVDDVRQFCRWQIYHLFIFHPHEFRLLFGIEFLYRCAKCLSWRRSNGPFLIFTFELFHFFKHFVQPLKSLRYTALHTCLYHSIAVGHRPEHGLYSNPCSASR